MTLHCLEEVAAAFNNTWYFLNLKQWPLVSIKPLFDVNVSLLISALAPLCPKPTPPVGAVANHFGTVVASYICGFLPWTFLALFDFISPKWKTVLDTSRRLPPHFLFHISRGFCKRLRCGARNSRRLQGDDDCYHCYAAHCSPSGTYSLGPGSTACLRQLV